MDESVRVIGVVPGLERARRRRLLDALEAAYPVRFEGREQGAVAGLDALLTFCAPGIPAAERPAGIPSLRYENGEGAPGGALDVSFAEHPALTRALRGAQLSEAHATGFAPLEKAPGEVALASLAGAPAWVRRVDECGPHDRVAVAPDELGLEEVLRNRLRPGRCLAILALVQFLRDVTPDGRWQLPAPRAAFVIDDPNLRWPTYGHLSYEKISRSAAANRYHVSIAMVPLDAWPAHPRAVGLFRERTEQLSLCIHGNDHCRGELGRPRSGDEVLPRVAQALRRVQAFERRTALDVDRVMVPPHERISERAVAALRACGYEAFASTRTFPWLDLDSSPDTSWLTRPAGADVLTGWGSATLMPGGFPLLVRMPLEHAREEIVIRAFLGQPVILYGHHDLLEYGAEPLEIAAAAINRPGGTRWESLGQIARSAVEWRRSGDVLELRMLGRRVQFDVPSWAAEVLVDATQLALCDGEDLLVRGAGEQQTVPSIGGRAQFAVAQPGRLELSLRRAVDPRSVPAPAWRLSPVARRLAAEVVPRARQMTTGRGANA